MAWDSKEKKASWEWDLRSKRQKRQFGSRMYKNRR